MAEIKQRKRVLSWWREEGEIPDEDGRRLEEVTRVQEKYDANRLRPGWSGRDAPPVENMGSGYAGQEARFDKLGSGSGEKPKKGDGQKKAPDVKETKKNKRRVTEDDLDLEMPPEEAGGGMEDENVNPENDIPPEMDDEALEGEDEEALAQDITVDIGGKTYSLVPEEEPEMEGEEGMEEEPPMEPEPNEAAMNGGVAAQDQDVTQQMEKRKNKNRRPMKEDEGSVPAAGGDTAGEVDYDKVLEQAMKEAKVKAYNKAKNEQIRKALQMKKYAEQKLAELFTGSYVINKQGESGFDFKPVGGDEDLAVVDRAASGNQYTPMDSESPYEPNEKGGKTQHMTKPKGSSSYGDSPYNKPNPTLQSEAKKKKEAFKRWLAAQEAKFTEEDGTSGVNPNEDPGETSNQFNKQDEFGSPEPRSPLKPEEYPAIPEIMGNEKDIITNGNPASRKSNFVGEAKKYQQVQQRRKIRNESVQPDKPLKESTVEQAFDFKAFLAGDYNK